MERKDWADGVDFECEVNADARIYPKLESVGGPGGEVAAESHST